MDALLRIINLLFVLMIYSACVDDPGKVKSQKMNDPNMKSIPFSDLDNTDHLNEDIKAFSATLNISESQSASNGGIRFELALRYEGTNDIAIHNPLYFVQYVLKGSDETKSFRGVKPPVPLINRKGPIDETTDFSFDILRITKNGEDLNIKEQANTPTVAFRKGDKQIYYLQISESPNQQTGKPEDLPEGTYHLELLFSIVGSETTGGDLQSRTLKVQDISVSFKKALGGKV